MELMFLKYFKKNSILLFYFQQIDIIIHNLLNVKKFSSNVILCAIVLLFIIFIIFIISIIVSLSVRGFQIV